MDEQKQQVAQRVREANNILVTVSANPSVDQLAACIGLTLALNKLGKHATAVFSGDVPPALEFLQPEKTLEKTTDSLRDFIIALDKSKADKLRYKVEDKVVKIFITPYRTSISDKDLEFSQGDFNVDVVLALGVHQQADLDQAITAHGRILHDAVVMTLNNKTGGELGTLNWLDPTASSLSELAMQLVDMLDRSVLDEQIATAMLTGIVAETERFSNGKTTPRTMSISAELMTAGANQQLVATKLEEPAQPAPATVPVPIPAPAEAPRPEDGTLEISHDEPASSDKEKEPAKGSAAPEPAGAATDEPDAAAAPEAAAENPMPQIHIDEHGALHTSDEKTDKEPADNMPPIRHHAEPPKMILEPPTLGGQLTASGMPDAYELLPSDPLTLPSVEPPTNTDVPAVAPTIQPPTDDHTPPSGPPQPAAPEPPSSLNPFTDDKTLSELEQDVHSPHTDAAPSFQDLPAPSFSPPAAPASPAPTDTAAVMPAAAPESPANAAPTDDHVSLQGARDAVADAINGATDQQPLPPIQALNAQPVDLPIGSNAEPPSAPQGATPDGTVPPANAWGPGATPAPFQPAFTNPLAGQPPAAPGNLQLPPLPSQPDDKQGDDPNAPPPVPPPMMPPAFH